MNLTHVILAARVESCGHVLDMHALTIQIILSSNLDKFSMSKTYVYEHDDI